MPDDSTHCRAAAGNASWLAIVSLMVSNRFHGYGQGSGVFSIPNRHPYTGNVKVNQHSPVQLSLLQ